MPELNPRGHYNVHIEVDEDQNQMIERACTHYGLGRAAYIRSLIERADRETFHIQKGKTMLWAFHIKKGGVNLFGVFKATSEEVKAMTGKKIFIPDAFGPYQNAEGELKKNYLRAITADPYLVKHMPQIGYDPRKYIKEEEE